MIVQGLFDIDFDDSRRILHIVHPERINLRTKAQIDEHFSKFRDLLDKYIESGRIYLIINMSNFIIDQDLTAVYAKHAQKIGKTYIHQGGIARYGYQITRMTVIRGYREYLHENPNIFNTRDEAESYIYGLIDKSRNVTATIPEPNLQVEAESD